METDLDAAGRELEVELVPLLEDGVCRVDRRGEPRSCVAVPLGTGWTSSRMRKRAKVKGLRRSSMG